MIDADHRTTYVNPRMAEMLGYEVDEMLGRPVVEFTPSDRHGGVRKHIQSRRDGAADQREELLRHKDGSEVWVLLAGSPITDREGRYAGALAMMADITERKRAEARAAQLAGLVEASPDAIVSVSLEGVIETINAAAERQSGWTAAEVVGQPVATVLPPESAAVVPLLLTEVAAGKPIERLRTELVAKDGRREDVSLSLAPIPGRDGAAAGIACVIRASDG
jgi:PAS domain S-box-containing protein